MLNIGLVTAGFRAHETDWFLPWQTRLVHELQKKVAVRVFPLRYPVQDKPYQVDNVWVFPHAKGQLPGIHWLRMVQNRWWTMVQEHRRKPFDRLHAIWANEPGAIAALVAKSLKLPLTVTLAGGELTGLKDIRYGSQLSGLQRQCVRYTLNQADQIVVGSDYIRDQCRSLFPASTAKLHKIPLGVEIEHFSPLPEKATSTGELRLIAVGGLIPVKDHATLIRGAALAYRQGVKLRLDLIGEGSQREALQYLIQQEGLADRVRLPGWIPHHKLAAYYQQADVVALTSRHESFCLSILEGMACGLPAIATPVGVLPEVIQPGQTGFIVPIGDARAVAEALIRLAHHPERDTMGKRATIRIQHQFRWEPLVAQLIHLYAT
ncbi:MAG: glycosyltransferase family 1 protein [Gemmatimonadetes bacterium]|nr:MAG: glycosyltransferase family 1 protein [Gemmatimonadota bacterium]